MVVFDGWKYLPLACPINNSKNISFNAIILASKRWQYWTTKDKNEQQFSTFYLAKILFLYLISSQLVYLLFHQICCVNWTQVFNLFDVQAMKLGSYHNWVEKPSTLFENIAWELILIFSQEA